MSTKKIFFINHFAGIPKINERSMRHFILAEAANSNGFDSYIITSQNHYHAINERNIHQIKLLK